MNVEDNCFCDLAPLYALGVLTNLERAQVEAQITDELAVELGEFQAAVAAIAYSAPTQPLSTDLKARLFQNLAIELPAPAPPPAPAPSLVGFAFQPQDIVWQPHPTPGVTVAILHTDPVKREIVGLLKAQPGVRYPWHRHASTEEIFMVAGELQIGDTIYGEGSYIVSAPGSAHAPETAIGCTFLYRTSLDDEYPSFIS
jgi:quercetin dioxygenase-like cupin family protein